MLPIIDDHAKLYRELNEGLEVGAGIEQYIDVHG